MIWTIIKFVILLVSHAVAGIYSSTIKYSKKATYIIWCIFILIQTILLSISEFVLTDKTLKFFVGFVLSLIGQYIIFFLTTKGRIAQRIFTILTYSIFFCIFMTFNVMLTGTFPNIYPIFSVLIHAAILFGIDYYFLQYICPLCKTAGKNITNGWLTLIFVNIVFLITVILSSVFPVKLTNFYDSTCITYVFLSVSIMTVYPVIFSNINSLSEAATKREVETQNKLLLAQIEAETLQLEADSQARHDRRHHNLIVLEYAKNNDAESIREYLENLIEDEIDIFTKDKYCDNLTINTILTVYERRARENNISTNISALASRIIDIAPQDLVIIIANLFENAINATTKLNDDKKFINITIKEDSRRLLIKIENSCKEKLIFDESNYGVGIRSVITTTGKYDGMYDFSAEDGLFSAKISLNLK